MINIWSPCYGSRQITEQEMKYQGKDVGIVNKNRKKIS